MTWRRLVRILLMGLLGLMLPVLVVWSSKLVERQSEKALFKTVLKLHSKAGMTDGMLAADNSFDEEQGEIAEEPPYFPKTPRRVLHLNHKADLYELSYKSTHPMAPICNLPPVLVMGYYPFSTDNLQRYYGVKRREDVPPGAEQELILMQKNSLITLSTLAPMIKTVVFTKNPFWKQVAAELRLDVAEKDLDAPTLVAKTEEKKNEANDNKEKYEDEEQDGEETQQYEGENGNLAGESEGDTFEVNIYGLPYFRSLMGYLEANYFAPFYGVTDPNILYSHDIVDTLKALVVKLCNFEFENSKLVLVSKRMSAVVPPDFSLEELIHEGVENKTQAVRKPLKSDTAISYIIMTRGQFVWNDVNSIPDYVIGRQNVYQSVMYMAKLAGGVLIDGTQTITNVGLNDANFIFYNPVGITEPDKEWNLELDNPMEISSSEFIENNRVKIAHYYVTYRSKKVLLERTSNPKPSNSFP